MSQGKIAADGHRRSPEYLRQTWAELGDRYLPAIDHDSMWRYNRPGHPSDLEQGWKLHVSATILNATEILQRIAPVLIAAGVQFKAPRSLDEILKLNSGLLGSYSQVGKVFTVYPNSDDEAVHLAQVLHRLTYRFRSPAVPFDLRLCDQSNVFYRYGSFKQKQIKQEGALLPAVMSPDGNLVADLRENPKPEWVCDPFAAARLCPPRQLTKNAASRFVVGRALVQRGKGGVYLAIDTESQPPRLCLLKEGRRHGELNWDGRDGAWRLRHEERVLSALSRCGLRVPQVYSRLDVSGNVYLALEFVDGENLFNRLMRRQRRLPVESILDFGIQIAEFLETMHRAGWAWRDCKPSNLLVAPDGRLTPIDFEGAEQIKRPDPVRWGTPGFVPAVRDANEAGFTDDLFALGAILFFLIAGRMFDAEQPIPLERLRRQVPLELRQLVKSLLHIDPRQRPSARTARRQMEIISRPRHRAKRPDEARAA